MGLAPKIPKIYISDRCASDVAASFLPFKLCTSATEKEKFQGITILDGLSASGLRTIRFLKELEDIRCIYANDISLASHKLMKENFELNDLDMNKVKSMHARSLRQFWWLV